jgi:hypothetical protein
MQKRSESNTKQHKKTHTKNRRRVEQSGAEWGRVEESELSSVGESGGGRRKVEESGGE